MDRRFLKVLAGQQTAASSIKSSADNPSPRRIQQTLRISSCVPQPFLGFFNALADSPMLDRHAFPSPSAAWKGPDYPVRREDPQQVVIKAQEELAGAGVALTSGAAAQLIVDPPRLVPLGAQDAQSAGPFLAGANLKNIRQRIRRFKSDYPTGAFLSKRADLNAFFLRAVLDFLNLIQHARPQFDIRSAAGHVCGDGDIAAHRAVRRGVLMAGFFHNGRLASVLFGVEHLVIQPVPFGQRLGDGLAFSMLTVPTRMGRPAALVW